MPSKVASDYMIRRFISKAAKVQRFLLKSIDRHLNSVNEVKFVQT